MRVVLLDVELMARGRIDPVLERAGAEVSSSADPATVGDDVDLVIVDLDRVGAEGATRLGEALGARRVRVVGFLSHIDEALADAATKAGIEAYPRGRFWRELPDLVAGGSPQPGSP
jgi:DNA-binding NarL/FixJ family response regulator